MALGKNAKATAIIQFRSFLQLPICIFKATGSGTQHMEMKESRPTVSDHLRSATLQERKCKQTNTLPKQMRKKTPEKLKADFLKGRLWEMQIKGLKNF